MADKETYVYTDDGLKTEDEMRPSSSRRKLRKIYFVAPWILIGMTIIWAFAQGGVGGTLLGVGLIIVAPLLGVIINVATFYYLAVLPMRRALERAQAERVSKIRDA